MGQVEDSFEIDNREAAVILQTILRYSFMRDVRGNGKSTMTILQRQALAKAIDILLKTPDEPKSKYQKDGYVKPCPHCDDKSSHPSPVLNGESKRRYNHFCPKCMKTWNECDDE